ncbi:MAG: hypothetical protein GC164_05045 [Phycisphaera sp.]|nr:hypothetical protein [Phycisphaera sp.]
MSSASNTQASIEQVMQSVASYDRPTCMEELRKLPDVRLDFTDDFLNAMSLERLRHVVMAAMWQKLKRGVRSRAR